MKLDHFLTLYAKTNSKQIKELNVRPEIIKLLEENIGMALSDIVLNIFFDTYLQARETKAEINKWTTSNKMFLYTEGNHEQKVEDTKRKKIFVNYVSDKWLISTIHK